MYVSRRKRDGRTQAPAEERIIPAVEADVGMPEGIPSETSPDAEPLMLEREIILEPEDEGEWQGAEPPDALPEQEPDDGEVAVPDDPQDLGDAEGEGVSYEDFIRANTDTGVLRVQASAGGQSIPLANVNVTVYRDLSDGRHIFYQVTTNPDGVADGMLLPAPPRINSVEGNSAAPFADYTVLASREGLRPLTVENVPIFPGVRSIQPITLSPEAGEV